MGFPKLSEEKRVPAIITKTAWQTARDSFYRFRAFTGGLTGWWSAKVPKLKPPKGDHFRSKSRPLHIQTKLPTVWKIIIKKNQRNVGKKGETSTIPLGL